MYHTCDAGVFEQARVDEYAEGAMKSGFQFYKPVELMCVVGRTAPRLTAATAAAACDHDQYRTRLQRLKLGAAPPPPGPACSGDLWHFAKYSTRDKNSDYYTELSSRRGWAGEWWVRHNTNIEKVSRMEKRGMG